MFCFGLSVGLVHSSAIHSVSIWHYRHMVDASSIAYPNLLAKTQGLGEGQFLGKWFKTVLVSDINPYDSQEGSPVSVSRRGSYSQENF